MLFRSSSDPTPPYKMLRRSEDSPVTRHGADATGQGKPKASHTLGRVKDGGKLACMSPSSERCSE